MNYYTIFYCGNSIDRSKGVKQVPTFMVATTNTIKQALEYYSEGDIVEVCIVSKEKYEKAEKEVTL